MDPEYLAALVFLVLLGGLILMERKKISLQKILFPVFYLVMYRTEIGISLMDRVAKKIPRTLRVLGIIGIGVGFLGMILLVGLLVQNFYELLTKPEAVAGVGLVLPVRAKGVFFVPFFYWIISIFLLAAVHEFSHGVVARAYKMKVKSSGFAVFSIFVPLIPAAFVEPDEKELQKRPYKEQLSVFAAGPFSNVLFAGVILLSLLFIISPLISHAVAFKGVTITGFGDTNVTTPAQRAGVLEGETIIALNGTKVLIVDDLATILSRYHPEETVTIQTESGFFPVTLGEHPLNKSIPYLGVSLEQKFAYKGWFNTYPMITNALLWITGMPQRVGWQLSYPVRGYGLGLLFWLYLLNVGIGMFNLVPIGPVDGGRMIQLPLRKLFGQEKGDRVWKYVSLITLAIVLGTMVFAFL